MLKTKGIHHVSSIVGHAQQNIDFNAGILAQRLVKQTLNFDDQNSFHLYFGNHDGSSGLTTTFPMHDSYDGRMGGGQVEAMQYAVRPGQLEFWQKRLDHFGIKSEYLLRFSQNILRFQDPSGLNLELVESEKGSDNKWVFANVSGPQQIVGIEAVTLLSRSPRKSLHLLTDILGYEIESENDAMYQLKVSDDLGGRIYLAKDNPKQGNVGVGSVHHLAFRINDDEIEMWRDRLIARGYQPTEVKNRKYFRSIYFREKGGILIELATEGPGLLIDETIEELGQSFLIPPNFSDMAEEITNQMMPLLVREVDKIVTYSYRNRYEYEIVSKRQTIQEKIKQLNEQAQLTEADKAEISRLKREFVKMK